MHQSTIRSNTFSLQLCYTTIHVGTYTENMLEYKVSPFCSSESLSELSVFWDNIIQTFSVSYLDQARSISTRDNRSGGSSGSSGGSMFFSRQKNERISRYSLQSTWHGKFKTVCTRKSVTGSKTQTQKPKRMYI